MRNRSYQLAGSFHMSVEINNYASLFYIMIFLFCMPILILLTSEISLVSTTSISELRSKCIICSCLNQVKCKLIFRSVVYVVVFYNISNYIELCLFKMYINSFLQYFLVYIELDFCEVYVNVPISNKKKIGTFLCITSKK